MPQQISFIGLGKMGEPIARNLLKAGYDLRVYNRSTEKAEALVAEGAQRAEVPFEAVEPGGVVFTMLSNDVAVKEVVAGEHGFLHRLGHEGVHVSLSTISPETSRELARLHAEYGSQYVASPVFGRPDAAAARKLWLCVSGPEEAKARVRPFLEAIGQGSFDYGEDPGAANVVKLCGNFMIASAQEAMAEALTLAEKNGLQREQVMDMFAQTLFACGIYQNYGKMIAQQRYEPVGFQMELALKDLNLALDTADQVRVPMPLASLMHDRLLTGVAKGRGGMDWTALAKGVAEDAGLDKEQE